MMFTAEQQARLEAGFDEMLETLRESEANWNETLATLKQINRILGIPNPANQTREAASYVNGGENVD